MSPVDRKITSTSTPFFRAFMSHEGSFTFVAKPRVSSTSSTRSASSGRTKKSMSFVRFEPTEGFGHLARPPPERPEHRSLHVRVEDRGVHVALAAHRRRVAQRGRDLLDGLDDVALGLRLGVELLELLERPRRGDRP